MYILIPFIIITIIVAISFGASNFKNVDFDSVKDFNRDSLKPDVGLEVDLPPLRLETGSSGE